MRGFLFSAVVAAALLAASEAAAQQAFVGPWACQMSYTELNPNGARQSGFTRQYSIIFYRNGEFRSEGQTAGASGYSPFRSQGRWQAQGDSIMASGPEQSPSNLPGIQATFLHTGRLGPGPNRMGYTYEQRDPTGRYVMNRSIYLCEKRG